MINDFESRVLEALVTGYLARQGTKERFRSLTEYEIARRMGIVSYSYVEYDTSPERPEVRAALGLLQQKGLVSLARSAGRYDAFVPTESGTAAVARPLSQPEASTSAAPQTPAPGAAVDPALFQRLEARLDEIIRLLRAIERHLQAREQHTNGEA